MNDPTQRRVRTLMDDKTNLTMRRPVLSVPWCWAISSDGVSRPVHVTAERMPGGALRVVLPHPPEGWAILFSFREAMAHEA